MLEQTLRHHYQKILVDPLVRTLNQRITPQTITWLSGCFGLAFIPALCQGYNTLAIALLLLSGYCDTLDGSLARHQHQSSPMGSVLDIMMDRLVEFAVVFALYWVNPERALAIILMLGSMLLCITSFLVVGIFSQNESHKSFHYSPGLMERVEAFCFFIAMVLLPHWFNGLAAVFTALVCLTAVIRLMQFARADAHFRSQSNPLP
ncbi:CDP-alcohol phosphatidyltransferase family protein [Legionella taurinensis]|uniref:CDP-alcohol phosphatidyltransferase family protein n=1 Tax=Legionella taurinensis TaxID=70611 RepID=A0AB38N6V0_9GAMM|nr:CDP-alcohol phosphatidyltransferase family protein [Legionella taurinensis]MDX1836090.1 CDP-alcohol phosphatidyltransferase family protein [Legionella taurinensis]PUT42134.1 CDP-alcohol phosphatidyltransferase family protein [Legionella taurinensis]PUT44921.1 CDP-alcohol phosphatidyltransferase family protein [Legionella taurinensis]PUT48243.1 CDP-alcohol phosphatidyltransferase family protein [Legionella taurinensis]PUT49056.1 CDP-alcohol phosphatidyltransferase family protein [Legionella 